MKCRNCGKGRPKFWLATTSKPIGFCNRKCYDEYNKKGD